MKTWYLFLLVYLLGSCCEATSHHKNKECKPKDVQGHNATWSFLQCVGLSPTDSRKDHVRDLKNILEATMDLYTFMKSSLKGVPVLSLAGALEWTPDREFENEDLVKMWLEVKIKPLLKSINKQFLSCLSTKNFTCSTYQAVVMQLSQYYSEMDPVRQKWIYMFFMYPFLSGENMKGCVMQNESSEDWLMKNFGYFKAMARFSDFTKINVEFQGLEVLHLLTSTQTAELLLTSNLDGLTSDMQTGIFRRLSERQNNTHTTRPHGGGQHQPYTDHQSNSTTMSKLSYKPPSPEDHIRWVFNDVVSAMRPVGNIVHKFVALTHKKNQSEMTSAVLTQFALDSVLAEMANSYKPQVQEQLDFNVLDLEDWYKQVVMPLLRRFLPHDMLPHGNIRLAFEEVYYLDHEMNEEDLEVEDACSITLNEKACVLTDTVKNVAQVLHCAARCNLQLDEQRVMQLINQMLKRLNSVLEQLTTSDSLMEEIREIFTEDDSQSITEEHLNDPEFIKLWFKVKMMPLLPNVSADLLLCLSTKNFSCPVYQTIVGDLSQHMMFLDVDPKYGHRIYKHFIYPFLLNGNTSRCLSNDSAEWLKRNFGFFLRFAELTDFFELNPHFDPLAVLPHLSVKHLVHLMLMDLPIPAEKRVEEVFNLLRMHPDKFTGVLELLPRKAEEIRPPCSVYQLIFKQLDAAIEEVNPNERLIRETKQKLINSAPEGCVTDDIACPITRFNDEEICRDVDSSNLERHLSSLGISCDYTLQEYACAELQDFSADHLVSLMLCDLPGPSSKSKVLWKMVLTKVFSVWDPALEKLAMLPSQERIPAATEILDLFGEMQLATLTEDELKNNNVISGLFSGGIRRFLPFASEGFLGCLSRRNLSCETFQEIVSALSSVHSERPEMVAEKFIIGFLSRLQAGPGCFHGLTSTEWLNKNFGSFSKFVALEKMLQLNPNFLPMEVLPHLSPEQLSSLFVLKDPRIPDKKVLIDSLFDMFKNSTDKEKLERFLYNFSLMVGQANLTCEDYITLFSRIDMAAENASPELAGKIKRHKMKIFWQKPLGCIINGDTCRMTPVNETEICADIDSSVLQDLLDNRVLTGQHCDFSVEEVACAELPELQASDLAEIMKCHRSTNSSGSKAAWKLLLSKANDVLDDSLDLIDDEVLDPHNPALPKILDAIQELRIDLFGSAFYDERDFFQEWLSGKLRNFLPAASPAFLSCLATTDFNCSTYQDIVNFMSNLRANMSHSTQKAVYTHFIKAFLPRKNSADPSCIFNSNNTGEWITLNLGSFSVFASFLDLQMFVGNFSGLEVLEFLTSAQLGQMCATRGQIESGADVAKVMVRLEDEELLLFFESFHSSLKKHGTDLPPAVRTAWLEAMFNRGKLTSGTLTDAEILKWLNVMDEFIVDMSPGHANLFFQMIGGRSCDVEKMGMDTLKSKAWTMSEETSRDIQRLTIQMVKEHNSIRCMKEGGSFYRLLEDYFMPFGMPPLTVIMSLIPPGKMHQMINSMPPSDLGKLFRHLGLVDSHDLFCDVLKIYDRTPVFVEEEPLPDDLYAPGLRCIWPMVLGAKSLSEAEVWKRGLNHTYMQYLNQSMIMPNVTRSATCAGFHIYVACLASFNNTDTDIKPEHVHESIMAYLPSTSAPRCYNASHPEQNSTAWFALYIGSFLKLFSVEDFLALGPESVIAIFTTNPECLELLNDFDVPMDVVEVYTDYLYFHEPGFDVMNLPIRCRCFAQASVFTQLSMSVSEMVLTDLRTHCAEVNPQITAAIAGNFGSGITASTIAMLGNQCRGLSTGVLRGIRGVELFRGRLNLGLVPDWNLGQLRAIIRVLMRSGLFQINGQSFINIGTLVQGVTAEMFYNIQGSDILTATANSSFVANLNAAPEIARFSAIQQLVLLNTSIEQMITNVPDELAEQIPQSLLVNFPDNVDFKKNMNKKKWRRSQAEFFLAEIASETSIVALGSENNISSSVLQGFTCLSVRTFSKAHTKKLIKACRRKKRNKVKLVETQLTCMYNYIKVETDVTSYSDLPVDVLLYYDYSLVSPADCKDYFQQLADADFSVISDALSYKLTALIDHAMSCLGVKDSNLTKENVQVLGNMCCYLNSSFIQNSDQYILEVLKFCDDLTSEQAEAAEALLLSGTTSYGDPSTCSFQRLKNLEMLPLYLTSNFYGRLRRFCRKKFLRYFFRMIRKKGVSRKKIKALKENCHKARSKRDVGSECVMGEITYVTITAEDFPSDDMDVTQFNNCLSAETVTNTLAEITEKVVVDDFLQVVLVKLDEAYPGTVPEEQVEDLGPVTLVATTEHVSKWNISRIDTLAALLNSSDDGLNSDMVRAIVTKYLAADGNVLGTDELRTITGPNLCSLDLSVLQNISQDALKDADLQGFTSCSSDKKEILFTIASGAFARGLRSTVSSSKYQLMRPYLGGASMDYIQSLVGSNVNMDVVTFSGLSRSVLTDLSVDDTVDLLGTHLPDLWEYRNEPGVLTWIANRYQIDLDRLNLGLTGGKNTPSTAKPATTKKNTAATTKKNTASNKPATTKAPSAATTKPGNHGNHLRADAGLFFVLLLTFLITRQLS